MRTVFVSLIVAAGLSTTALAQDQVPPATTAAPPAAAPAPMATPAVSAPMATPAAPAPAAPAGMAPDPAAVAPAPAATTETPPAAPAEAAPTLPTTGDGAMVINFIEKVCVPLVRGGKLEDVAKPFGMKLNKRDGTWTVGLGGDRNYTLTVYPSGSNKDVCQADVHYAPGGSDTIVKALVVWSFLHQPELLLQANYVATDGDNIKRIRKSWEHFDATESTAVNFSTLSKPDDTPLNKNYDSGEIRYQERKF